MWYIYGISAVNDHFNPRKNIFVGTGADLHFTKTICDLMAANFPGETYYVLESERGNGGKDVEYSVCVTVDRSVL